MGQSKKVKKILWQFSRDPGHHLPTWLKSHTSSVKFSVSYLLFSKGACRHHRPNVSLILNFNSLVMQAWRLTHNCNPCTPKLARLPPTWGQPGLHTQGVSGQCGLQRQILSQKLNVNVLSSAFLFFNRERFLLPFVYLNLLGSFSMHIFFNEKLKSKLLKENGTLGHDEGSQEKTLTTKTDQIPRTHVVEGRKPSCTLIYTHT